MQISVTQQNLAQRLHKPVTALSGFDLIKADTLHFTVQMGERRRHIELDVGTH
jgi:hypothetical protein